LLNGFPARASSLLHHRLPTLAVIASSPRLNPFSGVRICGGPQKVAAFNTLIFRSSLGYIPGQHAFHHASEERRAVEKLIQPMKSSRHHFAAL
jgi:hypothetical protein